MLGLSSAAAREKLKEYGKNVLTVKNANPWWKILFSQFTDILVIILLVAAGISFFLGEQTDATVISFIVVLNAAIGFIQEFRTEKTLEALKKMIHPEIRVFRDGKEVLLETEYLVPGDVVILGEGDKIPADGKMLESNMLKVEESALTGESLPVEKKEKEELFMGTSVVHGSGMFEVTLTGMQTKFGEIAQLSAGEKRTKSPLQKELIRIGVFVTKVTAVICLILFGVGLLRNLSLIDSLLFSVSVAIAAVPEGLPTTITIALALGATVLARKKAVIKKLSSVETLGAVTTICSDKTGTLTRNEMTVREIYLPDRSIFEVSGVGYNPRFGKIDFIGGSLPGSDKDNLLHKLLEVCGKCNEAKLEKKHGKYFILGDPTEGALLTLVEKAKSKFTGKRTKIFPFDSDRKMMSIVMSEKIKNKTEQRVLVKGSPDHVLAKCTHWSDGKKLHRMTADKRAHIQGHYERMAQKALRVLAFAGRNLTAKEEIKSEKEAEKKLVFYGLVGMIDPPREEVRKAVDNCMTAGIRVIVITGDFGITAEAVAQELGIIAPNNEAIVLTGAEVKKMSDAKLSKLLKSKKHSLIFARSLPDQKMRIVKLLQKQGEIVAMTGDGVNDAPALKVADIGVAMGITGTEVSKEAATMILSDDSFASIVTAVGEGRRIYENLKKFVWFIFSCNIGELFLIFAAIIFQFPLPLTAILILCVDLGTDILPAIALGVDGAEDGLMKRAPRDPNKRLMNRRFTIDFLITGCVIGISIVMVFLWTIFKDGWHGGISMEGDWNHAQTVAFTALVFVQLINAFSARSEKTSLFRQRFFSNHFLILAVITSILLVLTMIYIPTLNRLLGTTPLTGIDWAGVALASFAPLVFIEIRKWIRRKKSQLA